MMNLDELYIGYAPPMPPGIARFVKRVVFVIGAGVPLAASLLAIGHVPLDGGTFDFGHPQRLAGVIAARPYPSMHLDGQRSALLVAPGKHGADALIAGFDGQRVTFDGTRIQRGAHTMFEVTPGSIARDGAEPSASTSTARTTPIAGEPVTLRGEIVDSKCFLGVMVPGEGKTHKDCASLCLRGGIPPALLVRDRAGRSALVLLISESGEPLSGHAAAIGLAGEPVEVTGGIVQAVTPRGTPAGWSMLRTDPSSWRPLVTPAR